MGPAYRGRGCVGSLSIVGVPSADIEKVFPLVAWHFNSFAERSRGEVTADDLVREVRERRKQCWLAWDGQVRACALTHVEEGHIKVVEMTHCAGQGREDWQEPMVRELQRWAKAIGARRFRTINRPGWTKALKAMGLRETHRVMEAELGQE